MTFVYIIDMLIAKTDINLYTIIPFSDFVYLYCKLIKAVSIAITLLSKE